MLEVKKCYINNSYINDYWENNLIIDQSKKLNNNIEINIDDKFYDNINKYLYEEKEKLNNNYKIKSSNSNNEFGKKYNNDYRNTETNRSNNRGTITQYINREEYDRNKNSNFRMYNKEKSNEHRTLQKHFNTSEDKRKMHELSEKCRLHEYHNGKTKILLDSFSKPK